MKQSDCDFISLHTHIHVRVKVRSTRPWTLLECRHHGHYGCTAFHVLGWRFGQPPPQPVTTMASYCLSQPLLWLAATSGPIWMSGRTTRQHRYCLPEPVYLSLRFHPIHPLFCRQRLCNMRRRLSLFTNKLLNEATKTSFCLKIFIQV